MRTTSSLALQDMKDTKKINEHQAMYMYVFTYKDMPTISHIKATSLVLEIFGKKLPARNARIRELELRGLVCKDGREKCPSTGKLVNLYRYTGRTTALESRMEWVRCDKCEGKGGHMARVYYEEQGQKEMFGGYDAKRN